MRGAPGWCWRRWWCGGVRHGLACHPLLLLSTPACLPPRLQANSHQPLVGQARCQYCAAGHSTEDAGNTHCVPCAYGFYSQFPGAQRCCVLLSGTHVQLLPPADASQRLLCSWPTGADDLPPCWPPAACSQPLRPCSQGHLCEHYRRHPIHTMVGGCRSWHLARHELPAAAQPERFCLRKTGSALAAAGEQCHRRNAFLPTLPACPPACSAPGTFSDQVAADQCDACGPGQYANGQGFSACKTCPAGTYSGGHATTCQRCPPGFSAPSGSGGCSPW